MLPTELVAVARKVVCESSGTVTEMPGDRQLNRRDGCCRQRRSSRSPCRASRWCPGAAVPLTTMSFLFAGDAGSVPVRTGTDCSRRVLHVGDRCRAGRDVAGGVRRGGPQLGRRVVGDRHRQPGRRERQLGAAGKRGTAAILRRIDAYRRARFRATEDLGAVVVGRRDGRRAADAGSFGGEWSPRCRDGRWSRERCSRRCRLPSLARRTVAFSGTWISTPVVGKSAASTIPAGVPTQPTVR